MSYRDEQLRRATVRCSSVDIDSLTTNVLPGNAVVDTDEEAVECVICLEEIRPPVTRPCSNNHALHIGCAIEWRDMCMSGANDKHGAPVSPHCPVCRDPI